MEQTGKEVRKPLAGRITALRAQKKHKERVNVYLDGAFAFGLPDIIAATLRVGQLLTDDEIASLRQRDGQERVYNQALRFLSYRPRSIEEVSRHLARKQVPEDLVADTIARLVRAGLLDDDAFARYWVENRSDFRPRGVAALRYELRRKGVSTQAIEAAVDEFDEHRLAYQAARARAERYYQADRDTFYRRLSGFLSRRGFSYATTRETVERLWRERGAASTPE